MPDIPDEHRDQWTAFQDLQQSRESGLDGMEPITQREMESWFNNNGIETDERAEFTAVIQSLDKVWRREIRAIRDRRAESGKAMEERE
jgi:hypothetical protein